MNARCSGARRRTIWGAGLHDRPRFRDWDLTKIIGAQVLTDLRRSSPPSMHCLAASGSAPRRLTPNYRPVTALFVVAAPERDALREASYFVERLAMEAMPLAGLVLNRVAPVILPQLSAEAAIAGADRLDESDEYGLTSGMLRLHADRVENGRRQRRLAESFCTAHPRVPVASVAALAGDVHDLDGLREVAVGLATE